MAYEKQTWAAGQTITAEKMNHMEDGILNNQGAKGDTGPAGADGAAATIDSVTATVDSTSGTPACEVTVGGTEQNRTFKFAFTGLKGEKGDTGETGANGKDGAKGDTGPAGADGAAGAAGKNAPTITGCTINVNGAVISGQLTMSEGEPITITGTYTAGE